ncbi:MAG: hypothetical protein CMH55_03710 [Myxococcales bacterium]|nr:hypothetical protein [Myxococcales bacterium]
MGHQQGVLPRWARPAILLCINCLVFLAASLPFLAGGAPYGDDHSAHLALGFHLSKLLSSGATDFFWSHSNLGLPLFASYQPLPSLMTGLLMALTPWLSPVFTFKLMVVLVWASLPVTWYLGARWLGMPQGRALILGLLSLSLRSHWHVGLTLTSSAYTGLFTQSCGLWLFPLAVGAFHRCFIRRDLRWPWASLLFALTLMSHLFIGLLTGIVCALWAAFNSRSILRQWRTFALHGITSFLACAFWLVPLLMTRAYLGGLPWLNETYDGWSLRQTGLAFMGGGALDAGRWPVLSVFALLGMVWAVWRCRRHRGLYALCLFAIVSWLLMGGRETWGEFYAKLPMHEHVNPLRYLTALQTVALVAAAFGLHAGLHACRSYLRNQMALQLGMTGLLLGFWIHQYAHISTIFRAKPTQDTLLHRVAGELASDREHRFMVGSRYGTGNHFERDYLPMLADRDQLQSYALGYHATVSTYFAEHIRLNPRALRLFNVGSFLSRGVDDPPRPFRFARGIGPYRIHRLPQAGDWGFFDLVRPGTRLEGDLRALRPHIRDRIIDSFKEQKVLVLNVQSGAIPNIVEDRSNLTGPPKGKILETKRSPLSYTAKVTAEPGAWLMLKVNYFPYWRVEIDGKKMPVHHVGPNFMAVTLPGGEHTVRWSYRNPPAQKWGAAGTFLAGLGWCAFAFGRRFREGRKTPTRETG